MQRFGQSRERPLESGVTRPSGHDRRKRNRGCDAGLGRGDALFATGSDVEHDIGALREPGRPIVHHGDAQGASPPRRVLQGQHVGALPRLRYGDQDSVPEPELRAVDRGDRGSHRGDRNADHDLDQILKNATAMSDDPRAPVTMTLGGFARRR